MLLHANKRKFLPEENYDNVFERQFIYRLKNAKLF